MWAVVRIRGSQMLRHDIKETLEMLRLHKKNHCIVLPETPVYKGMVEKVKDFVTWGEIDEATLKRLIEKRSEEKGTGSKEGEKSTKGIVFRLSPPLHGFEQRGTRMPFSQRGALGYRGKKINELLDKMI